MGHAGTGANRPVLQALVSGRVGRRAAVAGTLPVYNNCRGQSPLGGPWPDAPWWPLGGPLVAIIPPALRLCPPGSGLQPPAIRPPAICLRPSLPHPLP